MAKSSPKEKEALFKPSSTSVPPDLARNSIRKAPRVGSAPAIGRPIIGRGPTYGPSLNPRSEPVQNPLGLSFVTGLVKYPGGVVTKNLPLRPLQPPLMSKGSEPDSRTRGLKSALGLSDSSDSKDETLGRKGIPDANEWLQKKFGTPPVEAGLIENDISEEKATGDKPIIYSTLENIYSEDISKDSKSFALVRPARVRRIIIANEELTFERFFGKLRGLYPNVEPGQLRVKLRPERRTSRSDVFKEFPMLDENCVGDDAFEDVFQFDIVPKLLDREAVFATPVFVCFDLIKSWLSIY